MGILRNRLEEYNKSDYCPMHMPGHKRNTKMLGTKLPYNIDITEIDGFDDLHHPTEIIKDIQERAKKIFGSKESFILVNGSTCGILAGIRSLIKNEDTILVARNCHKSVYNAIELNNLKPIYISPNIDEYGIAREINPKDIEEELEKNPEIKLVVLTSPTYEGIISNLQEIVKITHNHNVPVLVDEAHGAHIAFMSKNEDAKSQEAIKAGADIVIQSLHKTLPALTQTAILHIQGDHVKIENIKRQLAIFETSSPSYILMSSIDECLQILEENGKNLFEKYQENLKKFYLKSLELQKIKIFGNNIKNEIYDYGKIVIITKNTDISGQMLADILRKKYKIEIEMASVNYVIAMTSICDNWNNFERLLNALIEIDSKCNLSKHNLNSGNLENKCNAKINKLDISEKDMEICQAINYEKAEMVNYKKSEGAISKEYIWVYPPGVPIITPGEKINKKTIKTLEIYSENGIEVRTDSNKFPEIKIMAKSN